MRNKKTKTREGVSILFQIFTAILMIFISSEPRFRLAVFLLLMALLEGRRFFPLLVNFNLKDLRHFLPILIEFLSILVMTFIYSKIKDESVVINLGDLKYFIVDIINKFFSIAVEELCTTFLWFYISFQVILFFKDAPIPTKQIKITTVVLAVLFSLGHISNYHAVMRAGIPVNQPMFLLAGILYSVFCVGLYLKTLFVKSFSMILVIIAHFIIDLPRFYCFLYKIEIVGPTLFLLYAAFFNSSIYLLYTLWVLQKSDDHPKVEALIKDISTPHSVNET